MEYIKCLEFEIDVVPNGNDRYIFGCLEGHRSVDEFRWFSGDTGSCKKYM